MMEFSKITVRQFTLLVVLFTVGSAILYVPGLLAGEAKQDAWLSALFGSGVGVLIAFLLKTLAARFPNLSLPEYSEKILGIWLGRAVSAIFFLYFFLLSAQLLRDVGDFMLAQIMPETPLYAILLLFLAVVLLAIHSGLETIARAVEVFFPLLVLLVLVLFVGLLPKMHIEHILPVLEFGYKPIVRASLPFIAVPFLQLSVFLVIMPAVTQAKEAGRALVLGTLSGALFLVLFTTFCLLVMGVGLTASKAYPSYALAMQIHIGEIFQRVESMMAILWLLCIFFKLSLCFYASIRFYANTFKITEAKPLLLPLGLILVVLAIIIYPSVAFTIAIVQTAFAHFLPIGFVIPLVLLVVAYARRITGRERLTGSRKGGVH
ncbi:GerAB/ArcD/ProY family transporter [Paenibacillus sp. GCM10023248]|uniref:GerAB/ArcD/ProY family transporter n=1 Tax=unclassified Paenibacillus TaxID=185978 RepID=UPI0023789DFC|nr:GerAB/ArcD/ProY family transporter [Paenibacillus sp. MAHUQ-63]MDD9270588.1 GerAB/ArcD/ProY family transporter [Paenibacillus sp. MAHUQ-63]